MKEELMLARIRDAEHSQCMAELTHKLCNLELKVTKLGIMITKLCCLGIMVTKLCNLEL